ncbi:MAG: HisA/HisF-related TIM barrel protein, partial [Thermus sp.]|nr:HisA/HisF-related TIM barrel protein [Thermus sp.]
MLLIPAVDLKGGRAVRLYEGDPERETQYGDPVAAALRWQEEGARLLHLDQVGGILGEIARQRASEVVTRPLPPFPGIIPSCLEAVLEGGVSLIAGVMMGSGSVGVFGELERVVAAQGLGRGG